MMGLLRGFALLVLFCGIAVAQPRSGTPPTTTQKADIERLAKRAITKSQAGDHEGAIKDLLDAVAIHPQSANVLLSNVGHEYRQIKKPIEALKYYCMYLQNEPYGSAASYVKAETESLKRDLKLEGEACAAKHFETPKPDRVPDLTPNPNPNPNPTLTGTQNIDKAPSKPGRTLKLAGIGVAVLGAAVLSGGVVFGMKAQEKSDLITAGPPKVDANCVDMEGMLCARIPWDPADPERGWAGHAQLEADGKAAERNQIIMTVAGGAMIVGGVAMYFLGRSKGGSSTEVRVAPTASPGNAGLTLVGAF